VRDFATRIPNACPMRLKRATDVAICKIPAKELSQKRKARHHGISTSRLSPSLNIKDALLTKVIELSHKEEAMDTVERMADKGV
jgi:hypothetical protein